MGRKMVAVAVLEVNSVKKVMRAQQTNTMHQGGMAESAVICPPTQAESPDS